MCSISSVVNGEVHGVNNYGFHTLICHWLKVLIIERHNLTHCLLGGDINRFHCSISTEEIAKNMEPHTDYLIWTHISVHQPKEFDENELMMNLATITL